VDVDEAVRAVRGTRNIKAVVMIAVVKPAIRFIERLRSTGATDIVFTNLSVVDSTELGEQLQLLGPQFTKDVMVTQIVPLPTSRSTAILKYHDALQRYASGERPDYVSLEAYLSANILVEGLRRAGRNLTPDSLVDALESLRGLDLGIGAPLSFGPSEHQASHKVWGTVLQPDGTYKVVDLE
jgi:ABC-type branched-subunit amino acid transport system substrate-binding protein